MIKRIVLVAFLLSIGCSSSSPDSGPRRSGSTVDLWQDFDFSALSSANLAAHDNCPGGTWTISDSYGQFSMQTGAEIDHRTEYNGMSDSGGTHGMQLAVDGGEGHRAYVRYEFSTPRDHLAFAAWTMIPSSMLGGNANHDLFAFYKTNGGDDVFVAFYDYNDHGSAFRMEIHNGTTYSATQIENLPLDEPILVTGIIYRKQNPQARLRVYKLIGGMLVQHGAELTVAATASDYPLQYVYFGSFVGPQGGSGMSGNWYFDDLVMDWTDALFAYPLGTH